MPGPLTSSLLLSLALVALPPQAQSGQVAAQIPEADARRAQQARLVTFAEGVPLASEVGQAPTIRRRVNPKYTPAAMQANVQGIVEIFVIVGPDGTVTRAAIDKTLDPELDQQALDAIRQWQFSPTRVSGKPTAVAVAVQMEFRLH